MRIRHRSIDNAKHVRYNLSNGAHAVVDSNNKLVAYNRSGKPVDGEWSWVRKDYQQFKG